jgi:hypothetical protein
VPESRSVTHPRQSPNVEESFEIHVYPDLLKLEKRTCFFTPQSLAIPGVYLLSLRRSKINKKDGPALDSWAAFTRTLLPTWAIGAFLKTILDTHQIGKNKEEADAQDPEPENFELLTLDIPNCTNTPQGSTTNSEDRQDIEKSRATLAWIHPSHFENFEKIATSNKFKETMQTNKVPVNRT